MTKEQEIRKEIKQIVDEMSTSEIRDRIKQDEQEEEIEYLEQFIGKEKEYKHKPIKIKTLHNTRNAIETVLSMLKENSAEIEKKNTELAEKNAKIEKKDKIIDLMAEK